MGKIHMEDQEQILNEIIERLDRIEKMLEEIVTSGVQPSTGVSDVVANAIVGGPDAVREMNRKHRKKYKRK